MDVGLATVIAMLAMMTLMIGGIVWGAVARLRSRVHGKAAHGPKEREAP